MAERWAEWNAVNHTPRSLLRVAASVAATSLVLLSGGTLSPALAVVTPSLVVNGTFADGVNGWRTNATTQKLTAKTSGTEKFARLSTTSSVTATLNDTVNTVDSAPLGTTYLATARVRTTTPNVSGQLRVREVGTATISHTAAFSLRDTAWTTVELELTTTKPAAELDVNVLAWSLATGSSLDIDDVTLTRVVTDLVVNGSAELAVQQILEILAVAGADYVGPLPAEVQQISVNAAGVFVKSPQRALAQALLDYLRSPNAAKVFKARGLEPDTA